MNKLALAALAATMIGGMSATAMAESAVAVPVTEAQATRGQSAYAVSCGGCHGADMLDIFKGYATAEKYYLFMSGSMPADNPGGLEQSTYIDILAYLLHASGAPAGDAELTLDRKLFAQIVPGELAGE
ncbi:MAG: cytochrome c [Devosia sp.]|jgi:mono/diheme cytochrome c family protein|uniref:c-type cytochrome n=1 Tax=unclassified Devosia TaxID=196773 RepID=UPI001A007B0C|nr:MULTISPECIES: cytochrome c [unclassified Devosia]MBF0678656.1 cytochrome c [Devosia sp.]WEJ31773.1 cytochrome c [Devosia sp. SD17-2]